MDKLSLLIALLAVSVHGAVAQKTAYRVDTASSIIHWDAKKVVGGHVGTIKLQGGSIETEKGKITGGSFVIDMNSLVCTDAPKLTGHLKNEDFFDVPQFPTATFAIKKVDNGPANPILTGDLTIRGITKSVSFPVKLSAISETKFTAEASEIKVNRLDFDIKYRSASFFADLGNRAIEDHFTLKVSLSATK